MPEPVRQHTPTRWPGCTAKLTPCNTALQVACIFTLDAGANGASIPASSAVALVVNSVYLLAVVVWGVKLKLSQRQKLLAQQKAVQLIEFGVQSDGKTDEYGIEMQIVGIPPPETPAAAPDNKE